MNLFKNKKSDELRNRINDQLAAVIAGWLIKSQHRLSGYLNTWFNSFSVNQKKWILLTIGLAVSGILISGVFSSFYSIPLWSQGNYTSAHIGLPSNPPHPKLNKRQLTDSLTIKIKSWKQNQ